MRDKIANIIFNLYKKYNEHPFKINCGLCEYFADELNEELIKANIGQGDVLWIDEIDPAINCQHVVLKFENRFYDAEEPYGVKDIKHIPCVARALRNFDRD